MKIHLFESANIHNYSDNKEISAVLSVFGRQYLQATANGKVSSCTELFGVSVSETIATLGVLEGGARRVAVGGIGP